MGTKKINATKHIYKGLKLDSTLELSVYKLLEGTNLKWEFKPGKIVITPAQVCLELRFEDSIEKELRINKKDAVCSSDKAMYTRLAGKSNMKVLRKTKVRETTWLPDFVIYPTNICGVERLYVESKGHPNEAFPIKFKQARYNLSKSKCEAVVVKSIKEMKDLIFFLSN